MGAVCVCVCARAYVCVSVAEADMWMKRLDHDRQPRRHCLLIQNGIQCQSVNARARKREREGEGKREGGGMEGGMEGAKVCAYASERERACARYTCCRS